jgi:hypothetical protein
MFPNKTKHFLLLMLFPCMVYAASPHDEVNVLNELVEITKKNLIEEEALLKLLVEYQKKREAFLAEPTSTSKASHLVRAANSLQKPVAMSQFKHLFSEELLTELAFFSEGWKTAK